MTDSSDKATIPKSTQSRISHSSVQIQAGALIRRFFGHWCFSGVFSVFFRYFAAIFAHSQTLGKQLKICSTHTDGPGNRGKMATEGLNLEWRTASSGLKPLRHRAPSEHLNLNLYSEVPRNSSFSIWWISGV